MARFKLSTFVGTVVVVLSYLGSVRIISNIVTSQSDCTVSGEGGCQNGGTCYTSICLCSPSYTGYYCETPLCNSGCLNGGTCVQLPSGDPTCLCSGNYSGASCQDTATYVSFEELNYAKLETADKIFVRVLRTGNLDKTTTVRLDTFDDTARDGINYHGLSKVLTFQPSIATLSEAIDLIHSITPVNTEFWAVLSNPTNGAVQSPNGAALVRVLDTDAEIVEVFPQLDQIIVSESDDFVEVVFLRSGKIDQAVTISVSTRDASMNPVTPDYVPFRNRNFTFMPEQFMLRVRVILTDNTMFQGSRFFFLEYSLIDGNSNPPEYVEILILDIDQPLGVGPSFGDLRTYVFFAGTLPYVANENSIEVQIPIYRVGDLNGTTLIEINTSDGTALEGADYQAVNDTFRMGQGEDVYQLSIAITKDVIYEGTEEYFLVTLRILQGGQLGRPNEGTVRVNIRPDPREDLLISLSSNYYSAVESGIVVIEVLREVTSGAPEGAINAMTSVEVYTIADSALAGEDFIPFSREVYFGPGDRSKEVSITLLDDSSSEGVEMFYVELRDVENGNLAEPYSAVVDIFDDDEAVQTTTFPPRTFPLTTMFPMPQPTTSEPGGPMASSSVIPIVIGVIVGVIVIFGLVLVVLYFCCKRRAASPKESGGGDVPLTTSRKFGRENSYLNRGSSVPKGEGKLAPMSSVDPETREYPRDQLRFHEEIGAGAFAIVYRAEAIGIHRPGLVSTVAVKMLKKTASETDKTDFMKELNVFKMLERHDNVMSLLGCCTTEEPLYIILDYMPHGNLQSYLQRVRTGKERDHPGYLDATQRIIQPEEVLMYSSQVARGMEYLGSKECVHRDLATRNILLGEDHVCKVSDFGLARDMAGDQQYEMKSKGRVPVRWLAPECLFHNTYTSQSDVWSFGVLMWELVTQGSHPYPGMTSQQVIKQVQHGYRLPKPDCCSQDIYDLMSSCWKEDPESRPTFQSLRKSIEDMLSNAQGYLLMDCFQENDYVYISPGQESDDEDGLNDTITAAKN